ncbi:hypothetical protein ACQUJT_23585, partial [Ralstonia pseudosolanacearum]
LSTSLSSTTHRIGMQTSSDCLHSKRFNFQSVYREHLSSPMNSTCFEYLLNTLSIIIPHLQSVQLVMRTPNIRAITDLVIAP